MTDLISNINDVKLIIGIYTILLSIISGLASARKLTHIWKTRHLKKVWGISDKDSVVVICSELDNPLERQNVEPREFIYSLKYGDTDAFFEIIITLLRLYPNIKLKAISSGEANSAKLDLASHLIVVGGPDYNEITKQVLNDCDTRFRYRSPCSQEACSSDPTQICLHDNSSRKELFEKQEEKDFGYIERIKNPHDPSKFITLIGGCHTIGVTAIVKAFSMAESEKGEIPSMVLRNAKIIANTIKRNSEYSLYVSAHRIGQTVAVPLVDKANLVIKV